MVYLVLVAVILQAEQLIHENLLLVHLHAPVRERIAQLFIRHRGLVNGHVAGLCAFFLPLLAGLDGHGPVIGHNFDRIAIHVAQLLDPHADFRNLDFVVAVRSDRAREFHRGFRQHLDHPAFPLHFAQTIEPQHGNATGVVVQRQVDMDIARAGRVGAVVASLDARHAVPAQLHVVFLQERLQPFLFAALDAIKDCEAAADERMHRRGGHANHVPQVAVRVLDEVVLVFDRNVQHQCAVRHFLVVAQNSGI